MKQLETGDSAADRNDDDENRGFDAELVQQGAEGCGDHERRCAECGQPIEGPVYQKYCSGRCRKDNANRRDKEKRDAGDDARPTQRAAEMIQIDWHGGPLEQELKPPPEPQELTSDKVAELETLLVEAGRLIRACRPPLIDGRDAFARFAERLELAVRCPFSTLMEIANFADRNDAIERVFRAGSRELALPAHRVRMGDETPSGD